MSIFILLARDFCRCGVPIIILEDGKTLVNQLLYLLLASLLDDEYIKIYAKTVLYLYVLPCIESVVTVV